MVLHVLKGVQDELEWAGLLTQIDVHDDIKAWSSCESSQVSRSVPLCQISYMDDIALPLQASCPLELLKKVTSATEILDRHLTSHNLSQARLKQSCSFVVQLLEKLAKSSLPWVALVCSFRMVSRSEWSLATNILVCSSHRRAAWRWNFPEELPLRWVPFTILCRVFSRLVSLRLLLNSRLSWRRLSPGSFCMLVFGIPCRLHKFVSSTRCTCGL